MGTVTGIGARPHRTIGQGCPIITVFASNFIIIIVIININITIIERQQLWHLAFMFACFCFLISRSYRFLLISSSSMAVAS
jgi:hypothetical protein